MKATDLDYDTTCPVCNGDVTTLAKKTCPPPETSPKNPAGEPRPTCGGDGTLPDGSGCPTCGGDGVVWMYRLADLDSNGQPYYLNEPFCPMCTVQTTADSNLTAQEKGAIQDGFRLTDHFTVRGTINRYQDAPQGQVLVHEEVQGRGVVRRELMDEQDEDTGGFDGRFGDWTPADPNTGPMADYEQDTRDQLQNQPIGGAGNEPYDIRGNIVDNTTFPNDAYPSSPDMTVDEVIAWKRGRGDERRAQVFEKLKKEMQDAGVL